MASYMQHIVWNLFNLGHSKIWLLSLFSFTLIYHIRYFVDLLGTMHVFLFHIRRACGCTCYRIVNSCQSTNFSASICWKSLRKILWIDVLLWHDTRAGAKCRSAKKISSALDYPNTIVWINSVRFFMILIKKC